MNGTVRVERLGKVQEWNDDRGYGFITPVDGGAGIGRVFFHVRDYERSGRRPELGEVVRYVTSCQDDGRPRAQRVRRAVQPSRASTRAASNKNASARTREISTPAALILVASFGAGIAWAINEDRLPVAVGFASLALSVAAYVSYALDKHAAQQGGRRIAENTLHGLEMLGGWPGALLAQRIMRHKTRKTSFRVGFWISAAVNCAALAFWVFGR